MTVKLMQLPLLYLCVGMLSLRFAALVEKEHSNGETWVEEGFKKKCTIAGFGWSVKIVACLTSKGTEVGIGQTLNEDGKKYTCEDHGGGTIGVKWESG